MEKELDKILQEYEEGNMTLITLKAKLLLLFSVSGQLPDLFRNFIRTHHLTSKWEDYLKENEDNTLTCCS